MEKGINEKDEEILGNPAINEVSVKKPEYDKNIVYNLIEQLVRDHQDGRIITQLLEVEPDYFVYSETTVESWESKNYYVNYTWDGYVVKADFTGKAEKVITNSNVEEKPLGNVFTNSKKDEKK
jgi:hypothetical protein